MSDNKISVIIPVYNGADRITKCLASVFNQSYKNLEVIVIDDGSTDNLIAAVKPWQDKIKFHQQANQGAPAARNFGFKVSTGELVIFLDADIILKPDCLEKMFLALSVDGSAVFAYSAFQFGWKKFSLWPFDYEKLKQMPYIHTSSLIRREFFSGFDESLKKFQDWDLFLTIAERGGQGVFIDEVLFKVASGGTMSNWLPSFVYQLPWLKGVKQYKKTEEIIKKKHRIS